jgi:hypothetical protein
MDDQEVQELNIVATEMLCDLMESVKGTPGKIWLTAMYAVIANSFRSSGFSYEKFKVEMEKMTEFYKRLWDKDHPAS